MKKINFKFLLLFTLLGGICFKASATEENRLVKYKKPIINNDITTNEEIVKYKENNGVLTTTKEESSKDQGKVYNLVIRDKDADTSTCEEKIYLEYILKILESEFNSNNKMSMENIFKNLNVEKNNGYIYVSFEVSVPIQENISDKILKFVADNFVPNNLNKTKKNLNEIINKHNLENIKTDRNRIIEEEIKKINNYEEKIENEYREKNLFNNPMQNLFEMNSMFGNMEKMFNDSFFTNDFFKPFNNNELDGIKEEVRKEEKEKEKNDIKNKLREKKIKLIELKNKEINVEKLISLINNIENLNSNGNYFKMSKSFSSISKN